MSSEPVPTSPAGGAASAVHLDAAAAAVHLDAAAAAVHLDAAAAAVHLDAAAAAVHLDAAAAAVDDPLLTVGGLFAEIWGGIEALAGPGLAAQKLTMSDFETLLRLARSPARRLRMSDLAAQIGVSTSGVTRITDRLERSGLVRREACPGDRRGSFVVITDAGMAEITQAAAGMSEVVREHVLPAVGDDLGPLLVTLGRLRDRVRPQATAGAGARTGI